MTNLSLDNNDGSLEITLDSGPDSDILHRKPVNIQYEYVQNNIKGIKRTFTIFDDIYINYTLKTCNPEAFNLKFFRDKGGDEYSINLTYLNPEPYTVKNVFWDWFIAGSVALILGVIMVYLRNFSGFTSIHGAILPIGILLISFSAIAFMIFYYKSQHKIIYTSYTGGAPVVELFHMPRNQAYSNFINAFEKSIYKAHHKRGFTMKYRLVGELKYLRMMNEADLITDTVYENARSKIFKHKEYQT